MDWAGLEVKGGQIRDPQLLHPALRSHLEPPGGKVRLLGAFIEECRWGAGREPAFRGGPWVREAQGAG